MGGFSRRQEQGPAAPHTEWQAARVSCKPTAHAWRTSTRASGVHAPAARTCTTARLPVEPTNRSACA